MPRPVLLDCNNICHIAMHSMGDLSHREMRTGVIFGFFLKLLAVAREFETHGFVMCWDSRRSIRQKHFPDYKRKRREARREMTSDEEYRYLSMVEQTQQLREDILPQLGFKNNFIQTGYESDDLMAYIVKANRDLNWLMVTSDNDMYQCLDYCDIYNPQTKKAINRNSFERKYGITPRQWVQAKAIGGCDSDNVPGVEGVADPKRETSKALKYIRGELTKGKIFDRIEASDDLIDRNIALVALPLSGVNGMRLRLAECRFDRGDFRAVFDEYGFQSFLRDFNKWEMFFD